MTSFGPVHIGVIDQAATAEAPPAGRRTRCPAAGTNNRPQANLAVLMAADVFFALHSTQTGYVGITGFLPSSTSRMIRLNSS